MQHRPVATEGREGVSRLEIRAIFEVFFSFLTGGGRAHTGRFNHNNFLPYCTSNGVTLLYRLVLQRVQGREGGTILTWKGEGGGGGMRDKEMNNADRGEEENNGMASEALVEQASRTKWVSFPREKYLDCGHHRLRVIHHMQPFRGTTMRRRTQAHTDKRTQSNGRRAPQRAS